MVDINNVRDRLIGSCNILYGNEDITQNQYDMCLKNLDDKSRSLLNQKEKQIFNEIRSYKSSSSVPLLNSEENQFFREIRGIDQDDAKNNKNKTNVIPGLFLEKICTKGLTSTKKDELMELLDKIKNRLYSIILERNSNKENSDYYTTLNLYNKIDNNRLEKNKINDNIIFLLEKKRINMERLNNNSTKIKTILIIVLTIVFIVMLVFYLI